MAMNLQDCVNDLLIRGLDDDIQASEVASVTMLVGGAATQDEVREMSLRLIREVVQQGLMDVGDTVGIGYDPNLLALYKRVDFRPWKLPFKEAMDRVEREWNALGRNPSLGEICWLVNTEKGKELGKELHRRKKSAP